MIICCNAFLRVGLDLPSPIYEEKRDLNLPNLPFLAAFCWVTALFKIVHFDVFLSLFHSSNVKSGSWNIWTARRFYVESLEIWAAWDLSRQKGDNSLNRCISYYSEILASVDMSGAFVEIEDASGLIQVPELEVVVVILIVFYNLVKWTTGIDLQIRCQLRCLCILNMNQGFLRGLQYKSNSNNNNNNNCNIAAFSLHAIHQDKTHTVFDAAFISSRYRVASHRHCLFSRSEKVLLTGKEAINALWCKPAAESRMHRPGACLQRTMA